MARAIFSHELGDPDFQWLLNNFTEQNPTTITVDASCLPIVLVMLTPSEKAAALTNAALPMIPPAQTADTEATKEPSSG
jgi:hypothetical protein